VKRTDQRADTRRRLLAAARDLLEARGLEDTHLRDVAAAAGVTAGTVFVHFADKQDLFHAALFDDLEVALDAALATGPAALEPWLDHVTSALVAYYQARPTLSRALLRESLLATPPWSERFAAQVARVHAAVAERFAAERSGDPGLFGLAFVSFYTFGLLAWVQNAHPDPRGLVARLVAAHLAGAEPR
jgi:AcrR family transcriptional regulator